MGLCNQFIVFVYLIDSSIVLWLFCFVNKSGVLLWMYIHVCIESLHYKIWPHISLYHGKGTNIYIAMALCYILCISLTLSRCYFYLWYNQISSIVDKQCPLSLNVNLYFSPQTLWHIQSFISSTKIHNFAKVKFLFPPPIIVQHNVIVPSWFPLRSDQTIMLTQNHLQLA